MTGGKGSSGTHQTKMDHFAKPAGQRHPWKTGQHASHRANHPLVDNMAAIQGVHRKIETVAMDVTLVRTEQLRIVGVPEKTEGPAVAIFVEDLILQQLQPRGLLNNVSVEHAHHTLGAPRKPGEPQRPIIACIFNYCDQDPTLQLNVPMPL
ncbi:hypothetical protein NDU88_002102 [Pleurodeles waltl]|uniref:Uncharacterized protein n=1 Tax=Pleurodeles waltl TaxID=8319 RepID=A0AAV7U908_PLEWA|nr:hypothetical protein NDU88_002102 [Pleurodeles waltl]